jgi:aldehyde dehydrogenase (NAD+)
MSSPLACKSYLGASDISREPLIEDNLGLWLFVYLQPHRFINNEFVKSVDGKTFDVINPSTEEVICDVQEASEKDVDLAVAAARKAFNGPWRKETPENRGRLLVKLADLFEKNADLLASVEALDNGKAFNMAKNVDVPAAAGCLRYYGGWADKIEGKVIDTTPDTFNYIRKEPVSSSSLLPR